LYIRIAHACGVSFPKKEYSIGERAETILGSDHPKSRSLGSAEKRFARDDKSLGRGKKSKDGEVRGIPGLKI